MRKFFCAITFLVLLSSLGAKADITRKELLLNSDWKFAPGFVVKKGIWQRVDVPHTWNRFDAPSGKLDYYRGLGTYEKELFVESHWNGKRLFLKFEGVNTVATVFVNGKFVGEHRGGYTAFAYEITDRVEYGESNKIMVRVNNAPQLDIMPLLGDFNMYGGIYRPVHLLVTEKVCITPLDYASPGVYLKQVEVNKKLAKVEVTTQVSNAAKTNEKFDVELSVTDAVGRVVISSQKVARIPSGEEKSVVQNIEIAHPHLWNGIKDPYLYTATIRLVREGRTIDEVKQPLGLRFFHVDSDKGFFLNGEHIQLRGVCRHQDRSEKGNALLNADHKEDMDMIREMGANAIRLSHYPHAPYFYDLLDQRGMIAWSEIPFVGPGGYRDKGFVDSPAFKENGKQQLIEMIRQNYNHPSICFWGLFNELRSTGDNPVEYVSELNELAHEEDDTRLSVAASNVGGDLNLITDLIAWNKYYGWYGGEPKYLGKWADAVHKETPNIRVAVSEYGAGASIYHHGEVLKKPQANSKWHPEEWQAYYHEENWKAIDKRPFIWGSFVWNMFDFGAAHRTEGDTYGRNDKGLVTFDRKVKKDAFYFYKANWNKEEPVLHITKKRFSNRKKAATHIRVYSNFDRVELFVNGQSQGTTQGDYGVFTWDRVELKPGGNRIEVRAGKGKDQRTDTCLWTLEK